MLSWRGKHVDCTVRAASLDSFIPGWVGVVVDVVVGRSGERHHLVLIGQFSAMSRSLVRSPQLAPVTLCFNFTVKKTTICKASQPPSPAEPPSPPNCTQRRRQITSLNLSMRYEILFLSLLSWRYIIRIRTRILAPIKREWHTGCTSNKAAFTTQLMYEPNNYPLDVEPSRV